MSDILGFETLSGDLVQGLVTLGDYVVSVEDIENGHRVIITKGSSSQAIDLTNGLPGSPGAPGRNGTSPTVSITEIEGGHRVTITDVTGPHVFNVMDGEDAEDAVTSVNGKVGNVQLNASDVEALPASTTIPTKTSDLTNDSNFITSADIPAESDPTVPSWAKQTTKPSYTAQEVGALPASTPIPSVDNTLTHSGQAADSKIVGDVIDEIKDALSELPKSVSVNGVALTPDADGDVALPIAAVDRFGVIKISSSYYGIQITNAGNLMLIRATTDDINSKTNQYKAITPSDIDTVIRAALLSNSQITDADKPQICQTIGAEPAKGAWALKGTLSTDNKDVGVSVDLTGCTELIISGYTVGTGDSILQSNNASLMYQFAKNGERSSYLHYVDSPLGIEPIAAKYFDTKTNKYPSSNASVYAWLDDVHIASINRIFFSSPQNVTECEVSIYAR